LSRHARAGTSRNRKPNLLPQPSTCPRWLARWRTVGPQQGSTAIALLVAVVIALSLLAISVNSATRAGVERQRKTALALGTAHEALIAYAVAVKPDTYAKRPGDLPCPDLDNDGDAELTCSSASQRIGRLPWKTLRLPDLRDGDGERLWYALSTRFKRATVNQCPIAGGPNCLNSDTGGTLTVRDSSGAMLHDGTNAASGAIAVIIAPGPILTRLGQIRAQDRGCTGDADVRNCEQTDRCSGPTTARCNPVNYLDVAGPPLRWASGPSNLREDNATFSDTTSDDGFVAGPIQDQHGNPIVNDTLLAVRYEELMPLLEQRVAREALKCLEDYASNPTSGRGRYPWAARVSADYTAQLADANGLLFGRFPQTLAATAADTSGTMSGAWPASCAIAADSDANKWWNNWKNLVFYALAPSYGPGSGAPGCGVCLTVSPSTTAQDKRVVVLVAGRPLGSWQRRGPAANVTNYLEDVNASGASPGWASFKRGPASATFNDVVISR